MILKTTTNEFCFINVSFYETIADPRYFFEKDYEEMPEYEEELDFDLILIAISLFLLYRNGRIRWANAFMNMV